MGNVFEITKAAATKIKAISDSENKSGYGLRIRVAGSGCSGPQYQLGLEEKSSEGDTVCDAFGLKVFIDSESLGLVTGATLDFIDGPNGSGFKISNPNASQGGGCGSGCECSSGSESEHGHSHGGSTSGGGCGSGGCGCG